MKTYTTPQAGLKGTDNITVTSHIKKTMREKGITSDQVIGALAHPYKVTAVSRYPGQRRYCGSGVAVIVQVNGPSDYTLVTVYLDGVCTPLREDQKDDPIATGSMRVIRASEMA